jgi:hypothetical protein
MGSHRHVTLLAAALVLFAPAAGQTGGSTAPGSDGPAPSQWSGSVTVQGYVVPHAEFFVSPVLAGNRERLHLEARYNYEAQYTGSLWVGYKFKAGKKLKLEVTPMAGGVFGNTTGVAPGYEVSLTYKRLEFSSTGEYVFDTKNHNGSFFYSWPELTYSPLEWLRVGLAAQRTKAYRSKLDIQRGLLLGFSNKKMEFTGYVFNLGWTRPTFVLEVGAEF